MYSGRGEGEEFFALTLLRRTSVTDTLCSANPTAERPSCAYIGYRCQRSSSLCITERLVG